jgi:hypothetical protein
MSIREVILAADGHALWCIESEFLGEDAPRNVWVNAEVHELLEGGGETQRDRNRIANAKALLDSFVEGDFITIGLNPLDKSSSCLLARTHPAELEIFSFRCLDPSPGIRILGAFSEPDVFICLHWDFRENFDENWDEKIALCIQEWNALFGQLPRHASTDISGYVSYNAKAV